MTTPDPIRAALERLINAVLDGLAHDDHPMGWARVDDAIAAARAALAAARAVPKGYIDPEHQGEDRAMLDVFYAACLDEGGTADEITLRGLHAVLARWGRPATPPAPLEGEVGELMEWFERQAAKWEIIDREAGLTSSLVAGNFTRAADLLSQLSAAAPAVVPVAVDDWRPIETAPKNGTEVLASDCDAIEIVSWYEGRFELSIPGEWVNRDGEVFYSGWWQPLPDHPPLPTTTPAEQEEA